MALFTALALTLVAYNTATNVLSFPAAWYVPANVGVGAIAVVAGRVRQVSWPRLGFGREGIGPGLRWGALIVLVAAAGIALATVIPFAERFFADRRVADISTRQLAYRVGLRIPVGTALAEEVLFRGVLYGMLLHERSVRAAIVGSSIAFGLWHIGPALELIRANEVAASAPLIGLLVAGAVLGSAIGGVVLTLLRLYTRGIVGPVVVHAGTNALATLAAWWVQR